MVGAALLGYFALPLPPVASGTATGAVVHDELGWWAGMDRGPSAHTESGSSAHTERERGVGMGGMGGMGLRSFCIQPTPKRDFMGWGCRGWGWGGDLFCIQTN